MRFNFEVIVYLEAESGIIKVKKWFEGERGGRGTVAIYAAH